MAASVLLRLAAFTGESRYDEAASRAISGVGALVQRHPTAFAQWLNAISFVLANPIEIAISGDKDAADAAALVALMRQQYRPFAVVAAGESKGTSVPLLENRPERGGRATAYVCRDFACRAPVVEPADLASQLASGA